ncbi:PPE domain-containing protein [Amycolatopsis pittospori]|uniref:PPE domain-containing protein n=1 Tax=Amycolatopsis pittospori TaxID=2749434 RepID=UPI0015F00D6C|nr:PPE domain-containing protein [Amycolatopsis pittospori]
MSGEYYTDKHPLSARARAKQRKVIRRRKANLKEGALGKINWECYEHRQLWDMIKSAQPPKLGEQAHRWGELAKGVDTATAEVRAIVQKLLLSWHGPSSAQAAESAHRLTTWASEAAQTSRHIGDGLDAYTSAITEARRKMPEPVHYTAERWFQQGYAVKALDGPNGAYMMDDLLDDKLPTKREADRAKAEAVRVMDQYEEASQGVRHGLPPMFEAAPKAAEIQAPPALPPVAPPVTPVPPRPVPSPVPPRPVPVPSPGDSGSDVESPDDSTYAASSGVVDLPSGGTTGIGGPGQGSGYGPGASVPGGGLSVEDAARSGRAAGGGFVGGAGSPVSGGVGQGTAGVRGGTGGAGFGMYPPMSGSQREEDKEHRDRYGSGFDLLDDLPPAYPPVFGE